MDPIAQVVNLFKSGYKTTEFYVVLLAGVWNAVLAAWHPGQSWQSQISGLAVAGVAAVYALARSWNKNARISAIAAISGAINGAAGAATTPAAGTTTAGAGRVVNPRTRKATDE